MSSHATGPRSDAGKERSSSSHATGPRSDAGKERSSLNAARHGLRSERPVSPGKDVEVRSVFSGRAASARTRRGPCGARRR